jgi:hypothetical protein
MSGSSTTRWGHLYRKQAWKRASANFRRTPEGALCCDCKAAGTVTCFVPEGAAPPSSAGCLMVE